MVVALVVLTTGFGTSPKKAERAAAASAAAAKGGDMILLANAAPPGSPDPQVNYTLQEWQLLIDTHDGLVAFKRAAGPAGTKLVPDLATAVPTPTNGGKTWKFTLRSGIKFSNGQTLTAKDVKATFVRLFKIGTSPNAGTWYNVIAGGDACIKTPKACTLNQGIVVSGNTITFHLTRGDPEFLDKLAVPFAFILPASTPAKQVDIPPPGTGPYEWAQYAPTKQIKLVRNPYFHVWAPDAQPAGNPDTITERFGLTVEAEVTAVENGQADWVFDPPPADRLNELSTKYPNQLYVDPLTADYYFAFNVRQPPFNNLDARKAVNYATDHAALVKIFGGPKLATPTCQILPPNFPGYRPYCPYTANPGTKWSAPDLAKARRLVAASGTKGAAVKVNTDTTNIDKGLGEYFVSVLNSLGYKATLQALSSSLQYAYAQNSKNHVQFAYSAWFQDYPAASDFINILLGCGSFHPGSNSSPNIAEFCDRKTVQPEIDHALKTGITNQTAANAEWAKIDHQLVDDAVWVPLFNPKYLDFVSKRVKNHIFSPQWYFLLDQASIK
ncbi:MAG: ABC transporter substrate-binding protein [Gaiellaceae bacterium]